jgi:hypothetical protein
VRTGVVVLLLDLMVNSMRGQWSLVISTLRDVMQRKVYQPSPAASV